MSGHFFCCLRETNVKTEKKLGDRSNLVLTMLSLDNDKNKFGIIRESQSRIPHDRLAMLL